MESRLVRFIRELKVPGVVLFIMVTVWTVGYAQDLDRQLRGYRLPAPVIRLVAHDTPPDPAPSTLATSADATQGIDDD